MFGQLETLIVLESRCAQKRIREQYVFVMPSDSDVGKTLKRKRRACEISQRQFCANVSS